MTIVDDQNWRAFLDCIGGLVDTPEVQSMRYIRHHPGVSCYEHSVFVSYIAFRLARRWGLDYRAAARAGLLHDLYLYDPAVPGSYEGLQCFAHPKRAAQNAAALVEDLSEKERNAIISHMWPLALWLPKSRIAYVVNLADKFCASAELMGYWKRSRFRQVSMA